MTFTGTWPALAACGAGLAHLAVAAGSPWWLLALLCAAGVAELGWGAAALRAGRIVASRAALGGSLALALLTTAIGVAGGMGPAPMAVAIALLLVVAAAAARAVRRRARAAPGGTARAVLGMLVGATLVAAVTTPALSLTEPGTHAVPHGEMHGGHAH
ncbi:hypothetical protein [Microbacterium barkeri]|uniref:hypothetical protein n=1 Tax=Microbacterium barkeri TaxID=33917 RepID=UPI0028620D52|nr:hypothetical protein [Microbacterium barkeri]MDR6875889.1 hypothetical protein [Microbacterium barkeri]